MTLPVAIAGSGYFSRFHQDDALSWTDGARVVGMATSGSSCLSHPNLPCSGARNSLQAPPKFPVPIDREIWCKPLISASEFRSSSAKGGKTEIFPC
jgi:hypothetical protein